LLVAKKRGREERRAEGQQIESDEEYLVACAESEEDFLCGC
jgi:hypothetical protein